MSVFGVIVCVVVVFRIIEITLVKKRKMKYTYLMTDMILILIVINQLLFIFNEGFSLYQLTKNELSPFLSLAIATALAISATKIQLKYDHFIVKVIMVVFVVFGLIYTEYFNGIFSFNKYNDFFVYSRPLKSYYIIIPYKIIEQKENERVIDSEAEANVYKGISFYPIPIKKDLKGENFYYYVPRGFGRNGTWFQFGIPKGQQV